MQAAATSQTNGVGTNANILRALQIIQNPLTDNNVRKDASNYLEQLKGKPEAVQQGYQLGRDQQQEPLVRHFGLSLLEDAIRHHWHDLDDEQGRVARGYVIDLGSSISPGDQPFIRNKIAQLWVELAKRSWALDWFDLDEILVTLWTQNFVHKELVLAVLENLAEDLFTREDSAAVLRSRDLGTALVDIFTSKNEHVGNIKVGNATYQIRAGDEGWLVRVNQLLLQCLEDSQSADSKRCLLKALATLRSALSWMMTAAIVNAGSLPAICNCLTQQDPDILLAGIEALLALYGRPRLEDADVEALVYPMCQPSNSAILQQLFDWSVVSSDEVESPKYVISKKLSEMISHVGDFLLQRTPTADNAIDFSTFFAFMTKIAKHESLIVSIPAVHSWTKLLAQNYWRSSEAVNACMAPLLEFACSRTFQYDLLPDQDSQPCVMFVHDEIELFPERQGFFLNYRKLCCQIIELISYAHLGEAISHVITEVDGVLNQLQDGEKSFDTTQFTRGSLTALQSDSQFTNVESAFRGFNAWRSAIEDHPTSEEIATRDRIVAQIRTWAIDMLANRHFKDPLIRQRVIKSAVEISNRALKHDTDFALKVLEHVLTALIPNEPGRSAYTEAVEDLHIYATAELMRLAAHHANYFITFYDQIETQAQKQLDRSDIDEKTGASITGALFLIIQRAASVDPAIRKHRLSTFLEPVATRWQDTEVKQCLSSFEQFARSQLIDQVCPYMSSINAQQMQDWSKVSLNSHGDQLKTEMMKRASNIPLRITRTLLSASTEKLSLPSYDLLQELWSPILPAIVESVMTLISYNHRLHDVSSWPNLSADMQSVARRMLQDRYWQSGITAGSMHEFHNEIKASKNSVEGFASSVRARIRSSLEHSYSLMHTFARLGDVFFNLPNVALSLSGAVFSNSKYLSPHHFSTLLTALTKLIDDCPAAHRASFLTPLISQLLVQVDQKCTNEWERIGSQQSAKTQDDNLSDEMKEESILRSLTQRSVNLISGWLEMKNAKKAYVNGTNADGYSGSHTQTMRDFVLSSEQILEPLLLFYTHAMSYHDNKSCPIVIRALRGIVPAFATPDAANSPVAATIREYISHDLMRAAITNLHDPHFVDHQKDIANLIGTIWIAYALPAQIHAIGEQSAYQRPPLTDTARQVLLSIPGLTPERVAAADAKLAEEGGVTGNQRHQRAIVLNLLGDVRGVRLSELGKIDTSAQKSKLMEKYLKRENMGMAGVEEGPQKSNIDEEGLQLDGVSDMFGA